MSILLKIGGIFNLLMAAFHLMFWSLFDWPKALLCLAEVQQAIMQELNVHVAITVLFFGVISLSHTQLLLHSRLGKILLRFIAAFYFIRAINQAVFSEISSPDGIGITVVVLLLGILYLYVSKGHAQNSTETD